MTELIGAIYGTATLLALCSFLWGLGSAGMNGMAESSMGTCLAMTGIFTAVAVICAHYLA